ncbi:MAG: stage II sporulation protein M [Bacteroidota bacterium]
MRESAFLKKNTAKWQEFEQLLAGTAPNPDHLADLFVQVTDDLSYARTQYPESKTTVYLNNLAAKVHLSIYRNRKEKKGRFITFWKYELPHLFYSIHKQLLYAFVIFVLATLVGAVSAAHDETFVRLILGDDYVNTTLANIENGDPMGIYKSAGEVDMFFRITVNNIKVSFMAFAMGIFLSFGTGLVLMHNGIMLGAFQYFFYQKGLLLTSVLSIWIHGTLEISSIVIAGAAGLVMGNSILFPGTYSRMESFKRGAKTGLKVAVGLVPLFIAAGFLESFVTRLTYWHWSAKLGIILVSALFIVYYFVIYPIQLNRETREQPNEH